MTDETYHVGQAVFGTHSRTKSHPTRTSVTDPLQIATIPVGESGARIGITFCPGKKGASVFGAPWDRDLAADITIIEHWGAYAVLTLIEPHEDARGGGATEGCEGCWPRLASCTDS